jgi:hypothetical protein
MLFNVYGVYYWQFSHLHGSVAIAGIVSVCRWYTGIPIYHTAYISSVNRVAQSV